MNLRLPLWFAAVVCAVAAGAADLVPFVIPATPNPQSLIAAPFTPIPPDAPRIGIADGHFVRNGQRIRMWGVNICFGANFPTHADAERIAARLAAAGVNSVRLHHLDTNTVPNCLLAADDPQKLLPEMLERLDYFLDHLAKPGIYTYVNIHVGRTMWKKLGLADPGPAVLYDKIIGLFVPEIVAAQKQYMRDLLGHINAYRKVRYADDPAIAFLEISNEDSFFMWDALDVLRGLPPVYRDRLQRLYAAWLLERYGDTKGLDKAWAKGREPLGLNLVTNGLADPDDPAAAGWRLEQYPESEATVSYTTAGELRCEIRKISTINWHLQIRQSPLPIEAGAYYTLLVRMRADAPRQVAVAVQQDHEPWRNIGLARTFALTKEWQTFRFGFDPVAADDKVRLTFCIDAELPAVEVGEVTLARGGREGLLSGETLENASVALLVTGENTIRAADRMAFLATLEKSHYDELCGVLKTELGTKALVTGTSVFGACGLFGQSGMDFIDSHAYWQHPHFPGKPWDAENWSVEQQALTDQPSASQLARLALERLEHKPHTVSEYNHPAPNDFQAETVPLVAAYGAAQDWDGIWFFSYSHRAGDVDRQFFDFWFDIDANPGKWGFMRAGAAIFRDAGLRPVSRTFNERVGTAGAQAAVQAAEMQARCGTDLQRFEPLDSRWRTPWEYLLAARFNGFTFSGDLFKGMEAGLAAQITWKADATAGGTFHAAGIGGWVLAGHATAAEPLRTEAAEIVAPAFAVVTVTALDRQMLESSRQLLVTACGRCENTGMVFAADRRSVGKNWGGAPVLIEPVQGKIILPVGEWSCDALKPDGTAAASVALTRTKDGRTEVPLAPESKTMWYLLRRK